MTILGAGWGYVEDVSRRARILKDELFFDPPVPWADCYSPFTEMKKFKVVPFGFLIFGIYRRFSDWNLYEYTADEPKTTVQYFSGVKDKFFYKYQYDKKQW